MSTTFDLPKNTTPLDARSRALRRAIVATFQAGNRGHVASAFSLVEILRVLFDDVLRLRPEEPRWPDRDRCIISKGHGCLALYVLLAEKGFFPSDWLQAFCKAEGKLGGHPEFGKIPGVEASTGSLGHGLAMGVGMALDARMRGRDSRTFVIMGDGEINEGSVWESALGAAKHRLDRLVAVIDRNHMQSYATSDEVLNLEPLTDKWRAFGWSVLDVDGHDVPRLREALSEAPFAPGKPSVVIAHTVKGKGVSFVENDLEWHHKNKISTEEVEALLAEL